MNDWRTDFRVYQGGLMRCCLATLQDFMAATDHRPEEGDTLQCAYHEGSGGMIFRNGAWRWNKPADAS